MNKEFKLDQLVRPNILTMTGYSSARDEYDSAEENMVFLDANENPFGNGVNRYPDPQQQQLKQLISGQRGILSTQILLGNGSDEVLDLLIRAFCEPNVDSVITVPPTYGMYGVLAKLNAIENKEVLLTATHQLDVAAILAAQDKNTKLLFVCSPNNPTGNLMQPEHIQELLENFNGLVVLDEAYIDFAQAESWISRLQSYPNLVITRTLSKAYGMAGIRLGICFASAEIIAVLNKIKPPYNVNELTQSRAISRLKDVAAVRNEIKQINREKSEMIKQLQNITYIETVYPSDANFLLIQVDDAHRRYEQLLKSGIVVRNRSNQPLCNNTLRFTIGTPEENQKLIQ
ncbi:MAG: histidinol-phosphate transaminase, partial [Marinirhabdus sp.]|nr:histidinol-phosphate transaminase [Marinirhabdus sp.]